MMFSQNPDYCLWDEMNPPSPQLPVKQEEPKLNDIRSSFYPSLTSELERLFIQEPIYRNDRGSVSSSSSDDYDLCSGFCLGNQRANVWDDFQQNGRDVDLDELDRIMRRMNLEDYGPRSDRYLPSALDLLRDQEMLTKARLLELIRDSERKLIKKRSSVSPPSKVVVCVFCRNNGEPVRFYTSHQLKDKEGNITCPILYAYTCPICGAKGAKSHTIKYCPQNTGDNNVNIRALRSTRTAAGRRRFLNLQ